MCDPEGITCSAIKQLLKTSNFEPSWKPTDHSDIVLQIASCAAQKSGYVTYYPFRDIGWGGFKEHAIKSILRKNGWDFGERAFRGKSGFRKPRQ